MLFRRRGGIVSYCDPHVPSIKVDGINLKSAPQESAAEADCVVVVTDHTAFNYQSLSEKAPLIVDSRNALKGRVSTKIVRL